MSPGYGIASKRTAPGRLRHEADCSLDPMQTAGHRCRRMARGDRLPQHLEHVQFRHLVLARSPLFRPNGTCKASAVLYGIEQSPVSGCHSSRQTICRRCRANSSIPLGPLRIGWKGLEHCRGCKAIPNLPSWRTLQGRLAHLPVKSIANVTISAALPEPTKKARSRQRTPASTRWTCRTTHRMRNCGRWLSSPSQRATKALVSHEKPALRERPVAKRPRMEKESCCLDGACTSSVCIPR